MLSQFTRDIKNIGAEFLLYVRRCKYVILLLLFFTFLLHYRLYSSIVPGIDTESMISDYEGQYIGWLSIGRFGLVAGKFLLDDYVLNPIFSIMTALFLLVLACVTGMFLVLQEMPTVARKISLKEQSAVLIFGLIVAGHPILTEQLYFVLQSDVITFSFFLLVLAVLAAHYWSREKNIFWLITAIILMVIPFSSYQAMIPLFICGAVGMTLLHCLSGEETVKDQFFYVVRLIVAFFIGFMITQLIASCFLSGASFLLIRFIGGKIL